MTPDTPDLWTVAWSDRRTGQEGRVSAIMIRPNAERMADDLNARYPDRLHWAVRIVEDQPPKERGARE